MIDIRDLHKSFGRQAVLKGIHLRVASAGITAILGPNGSGKSTLLKSILGMVLPDTGQIHFDGRPIDDSGTYRNRIAYLPQIARFPENLRVWELIRMVESFRHAPSCSQDLIRRFQVSGYLDTRLGHLSGGTRQKVNLVLALMYDTPVIILDEPTAGLDPLALLRLKEWISEARSQGKIIIVTTHILSLVDEWADRLVFLLDGNLRFDGVPEELRRQTGKTNLEEATAALLENASVRKCSSAVTASIPPLPVLNGRSYHPSFKS